MTLPLDEVKMVILVNDQLAMTKGKLAAQVAHASIYCYEKLTRLCDSNYSTLGQIAHGDELYRSWYDNGTKKIVLKVDTELEFKKYMPEGEIGKLMVSDNIIVCEVEDLGLTEIPRNSLTCIGIGPEHASKMDKYTGEFKIL